MTDEATLGDYGAALIAIGYEKGCLRQCPTGEWVLNPYVRHFLDYFRAGDLRILAGELDRRNADADQRNAREAMKS